MLAFEPGWKSFLFINLANIFLARNNSVETCLKDKKKNIQAKYSAIFLCPLGHLGNLGHIPYQTLPLDPPAKPASRIQHGYSKICNNNF